MSAQTWSARHLPLGIDYGFVILTHTGYFTSRRYLQFQKERQGLNSERPKSNPAQYQVADLTSSYTA
jgi:hypothetical protein